MMQSSIQEGEAVVDIFCTREHPYDGHGSEALGSLMWPCSCHECSFIQGYTCSPHNPTCKNDPV